MQLRATSYKVIDSRVDDGNVAEYVSTDVVSIKNIFSKVKKLKSRCIGIKFDVSGLNIVSSDPNGLGLHIILRSQSDWYYLDEPKIYSVNATELCNFVASMSKPGKNTKSSIIFAGKRDSNDLSIQHFPSVNISTSKEIPNILSIEVEKTLGYAQLLSSKLDDYPCVIDIDGAMFGQMKTGSKAASSAVRIIWSPTDSNVTFTKISRDSSSDCITVASPFKMFDDIITRVTSSEVMSKIAAILGTQQRMVRIYLHYNEEYNIIFEFELNGSLFRCVYTPPTE